MIAIHIIATHAAMTAKLTFVAAVGRTMQSGTKESKKSAQYSGRSVL
jgi:hypothetical protein